MPMTNFLVEATRRYKEQPVFVVPVFYKGSLYGCQHSFNSEDIFGWSPDCAPHLSSVVFQVWGYHLVPVSRD